MLVPEPVAQHGHAPLVIGKVLERLGGERLDGALVGRFRLLVGDQATELGLLLLTDGRLDRDRRQRGTPDRFDLIGSVPVTPAISSAVGTRPSAVTRLRSARPIRFSLSTT